MTEDRYAKRTPDIPQLLEALQRHEVQYVLTGSVAALVHGVVIDKPGDLDITPALDHENLRRLATVLVEIEAGLEADGGFGHWETQPDGEMKWVEDERTAERLMARENWTPNPNDLATMDQQFLTRYGNFDVVPVVSGEYETLMKRAVSVKAYGHDIWVAHVDDLLATLTIPRRQKDVPRVRQLREIQRQL